MFIPLTERERQTFLSETSGSFIPGYTGHCPTLKFQFGKCYGTDTKNIIRNLKDNRIIKDSREYYRQDDPGKIVLVPINYNQDQTQNHAEEIMRRENRYILGYTGYIPGINFRYGKSYSRSADESMHEFSARQMQLESQWRNNEIYAANHAARMNTIRSRDDVSRALLTYMDKTRYKERTISSECPPIAGYTGHIPRMNGNEVSLSKRYNCAAQEGLELLRQDKNRRNHLREAENQIRQILDEKERKLL